MHKLFYKRLQAVVNYLIAGGSSGVGAHVAQELLRKGHRVLIVDKQAPATKLIQHKRCIWIWLDLASDNYIILEDYLSKENCQLDGVLVYAGVTYIKALDEIRREDYEDIFNVNVWGAVKLCQLALKFKAPAGVSIVLFGSPHQECGEQDRLLYAISKGALKTLNRHVGVNYSANNVRCNLAIIGWTDTPGERNLRGGEEGLLACISQSKMTNLRLMDSSEYTNCLVFLLSHDSIPLTGSVMDMTGGLTI